MKFLTRLLGDLWRSIEEPQRSWQENERSLKILARKCKILEDLGKKLPDLWRFWQENARSLRIFKQALWRSSKNSQGYSWRNTREPQRSSWRSLLILKYPPKIFTRDPPLFYSTKVNNCLQVYLLYFCLKEKKNATRKTCFISSEFVKDQIQNLTWTAKVEDFVSNNVLLTWIFRCLSPSSSGERTSSAILFIVLSNTWRVKQKAQQLPTVITTN